MLSRDQTLLLVIDVQERMMPVIHRSEEVVREVIRLIHGCQALGIPIMTTEQYTKGLGITVSPVREALGAAYRPIEKLTFSSYGEPRVVAELEAHGRRQILLCGVEGHVCVYQTARHLIDAGFQVEVVSDAVSSRAESNYRLALDKLARRGAELTSVEMCLFELMGRADIPEFRTVSKTVK